MKRRLGILLAVLGLSLALVAPTLAAMSDTGFSDVDADACYAEAVSYVRKQGLMSGTSAGAFSPDAVTSRATLVTALYRHAGNTAQPQTALSYPDVPADAWYHDAVAWAAANNVVSGYSDGSFGPGDPVSREQLAVILWRSAGSPEAGSVQSFADQIAVSDYAAGAVAWARESGVITGRDGNRFDPQGYATRAETAAILYRFLTRQPPATAPAPSPTTEDTDSRILVAYFSRTGNTRQVAETVAELTGGDLFELLPETPYPSDYDAVLRQAHRELADDARPALASRVEDMERYDVVILGFPIWHGDAPMPVRTFLQEYGLSGKTVAPFATSGSSGIGTAMDTIRALCPDATVADGLSLTSATLSQVEPLAAEWLDGLGLSTEHSGQEESSLPGLTIEAGGKSFTATLSDTPAARALLERLPMTVTMDELNGNEKYCYLPDSLPTNAERPGDIHAGDLMLYGSDCLVLFYDSFSSSYSYTRLGSVDDPSALADALGQGGTAVTFQARGAHTLLAR